MCVIRIIFFGKGTLLLSFVSLSSTSEVPSSSITLEREDTSLLLRFTTLTQLHCLTGTQTQEERDYDFV